MRFKEYLTELSPDLLKRYTNKAQSEKDAVVAHEKTLPQNDPERKETDKVIMKRFRGINRATTKLNRIEQAQKEVSPQYYHYDSEKRRIKFRR